jgi:hypothetical protein
VQETGKLIKTREHMKGRRSSFGVIFLLALAGGVVGPQTGATAAITNGNFEDGTGWSVESLDGGSVETVASYGDHNSAVAHLYAHGVWYQGPGGGWGGGGQPTASLSQDVTLQEGQTCLEFEAAATYSGCPITSPQMTVSWEGGGCWGGTNVPQTGDWQSFQVPVLDGDGNALTPDTVITVRVESRISAPQGEWEGHTEAHVYADMYVDNLSLIPEPATLLLLALGGLALIRRKRQ